VHRDEPSRSADGFSRIREPWSRGLRAGPAIADDRPQEDSSMASISGGCACGAIRYECSAAPIMAANCFCSDCRHSTGTAMAPVLLVPKGALKVTGTLKHHEVTGDSGGKVSRGFCPNCGSPILSNITAMPDAVALKAGSLDDPSIFKPAVQVYVKSAPPWAPIRDDIPKFDKQPG
jgi:hypothetical protein